MLTFRLESSSPNIIVAASSTIPHSLSSNTSPLLVAAVTCTAITAPDARIPAKFPRSSSAFPSARTTRQKGMGWETREASSGNLVV